MKIEIKNYRGIEAASIECEPIALVCAPNGAGKTSVAEAVAAAITGRANIVPGVTQKDAGVLMRDGAKRGSCSVTGEAGEWSAFWPGCTVKATCQPVSDYAAGVLSLVDMKPKDVAAELVDILGAQPGEPETLRALADAGVPDAMASAVWGFIAADGWDAAHKRATSRATEAKGAWEAATAERWGAAKGATWRHPSTVDADLATLGADLDEKTAALERAIAARAVDAAEIERWQATVEDGNQAATLIEAATAERAAAAQAHDASLQALANAPRPPAPSVPCPHCSGALRLNHAGAIEAAAPIDAETVGKIKAEFDEIAAAAVAARDKYNAAQAGVIQLERRVTAGAYANEKIRAARTDGTSDDDIAAARAAVQAAKAAHGAHQANTSAATLHARIGGFLAAADVLAPTGIRATVARRALGDLIVYMGGLAALAEWQPVTVGEDGVTRYGGRVFGLLSRSEQFRARVLLQLAIAQRRADPLVVIDAADILDRDGRNGLFRILRKVAGDGAHALVTMTYSAPDDCPNLAKSGLGRTYWIQQGRIE